MQQQQHARPHPLTLPDCLPPPPPALVLSEGRRGPWQQTAPPRALVSPGLPARAPRPQLILRTWAAAWAPCLPRRREGGHIGMAASGDGGGQGGPLTFAGEAPSLPQGTDLPALLGPEEGRETLCTTVTAQAKWVRARISPPWEESANPRAETPRRTLGCLVPAGQGGLCSPDATEKHQAQRLLACPSQLPLLPLPRL